MAFHGIDNFPVRIYSFSVAQVGELWPMAKAPPNVEDLDFEQLGDEDLRRATERINEVLQGRFTSRTQEFREMARQMGFSVSLNKIGKDEHRRTQQHASERDRRRGVSPKYRNPDNPSETWAGRGRKPKWVQDRLDQGTPLDDLLIKRLG